MRVFLVLAVVLLLVSLSHAKPKKGPKPKKPRGVVQNIRPQTRSGFVAGREQSVVVNVTIQLQRAFKGAPLEGEGLWDVSLWLSKQKSGRSERIGVREGQVLTAEQSGQALRARDTALYFQNIGIMVDLRGLDCNKVNYLCASFDSSSPALKVKNNNVGCSSVECTECGSDFCTTDYTPVCGSDGQTYSNLCNFNNAVCENSDLTVVNDGECVEECGSDFCTTDYTPVCGSDGQTYSNLCNFGNAVCDNPDLTVVNEGECVEECGSDFCTADYTPVCGSDGQTYSNLCNFNNAVCDNPDLTVVNEGECVEECGSDFCTTDYTPVCGSDGQTYSNLCNFNNAVCDNPDLTVVNEGECVEECGSDVCTTDYTPVCGSDGQTYSNLCNFNNAVCENQDLTVVNDGACVEECGSDFCTFDYTPVCGSNGKTYSNICVFNNAVCELPDLVVVNEGECEIVNPCEPRPACLELYAPLCASNGRTYPNPCSFDVAVMCDDPGLSKTHDGRCGVRIERGELAIMLPKGRKPVVRLDVTGVVSSDSPTVVGDNLWRMELYGARTEEGNSTDSYEYRRQVLNDKEEGIRAKTGKRFAIRNVRVDYPLWDAACAGYGYLCARFLANEGGHPLVGNEVNLLTCQSVRCP